MDFNNKKNILYIITTLEPAGAQILVLNTLKFINLTKYNIFLVYLYKEAQALEYIKIPKQIKIYDLSSNGRFRIFAFFKIIQLIKKEKIDIIHTHLVHAGVIGKIAGKLTGIKHMITTRHYALSNKEDSLMYQLENRLLKYCSRVIAVSDSVRRYLLKKNVVSSEMINVIHNGINVNLFKPSVNKKNTNNNFIIGTIGRLHPAKGYPVLLNAFKIIKENIENVELEIIGEGLLQPELITLSEELGIASSIRWYCLIPYKKVIQKLSSWDLFVISSQSEGFGLVIIEAMALGLAVVASKVDGIVEIVDHEKTGYLFNKNDWEDMSMKITELLLNPKKRKIMGKNGREKVLKYFSIKTVVEKTENIYDQLN